MSNLPLEWHLVTLGDVVRKVENNLENPNESEYERFIKVEHLDADSLKIRRWGLVEEEALPPTFRKVFKAGQILYPTRNPHLRRTAYADFDGICGEKTLTLEPKEGLAEELFPFIFQREDLIQHATSMMIGSTNPHIRWRDLASFQFPLPPLDEQRHIAEILWAVEDAIEGYNICGADIAVTQNVYFRDWFDKNPDADTWLDVTLKDVCTIQNGQVDPTTAPYRNMIHIAADDIESRTGRIIEMKTAAEDGIISGKYYFTENAVLYSKIRPNLEKVALPDFEGVCSADMYPMYPCDNILREFLFYLLLSKDFTKYAVACSVRSAIPKINRNDLLVYRFKLPSLQEQSLFVNNLTTLMASSQQIREHIQKLALLKQKLLQELLADNYANLVQ
ncbi:MAG: restriction endonuclease subunit S [Anaerolineae bacterium]|nr:restriction endonuclease subunit S [Anaerolineae bacterium]